MVELFANSGEPDQTTRFAASDLGLHCLSVTRPGVSSPVGYLLWLGQSGRVNRKSAFEHAKIQIILHMCKVSFGLSSPFIHSVVLHDFNVQ